MATATLGNLAVTANWQDVTATYSGAASVDTLIQNLDDDYVEVVCGVASAPSGKTGVRLDTLDSFQVNAANIWVRGDGTISVTTV